MAKAIAYMDEVIVADSDDTVIVEGNHYFPIKDVKQDLLKPNDTETVCHWKGTASYYDVGDKYPMAAFEYKDPSDAAENIRDKIAFWRGIRVEEK